MAIQSPFCRRIIEAGPGRSHCNLVGMIVGHVFVERILSDAECVLFQQTRNPIAFLAKRFAAKEAIAKALGTGIGAQVAFKEISVTNLSNGKPFVTLLGKAQHVFRNREIVISLSDEKEYALAFAIINDKK